MEKHSRCVFRSSLTSPCSPSFLFLLRHKGDAKGCATVSRKRRSVSRPRRSVHSLRKGEEKGIRSALSQQNPTMTSSWLIKHEGKVKGITNDSFTFWFLFCVTVALKPQRNSTQIQKGKNTMRVISFLDCYARHFRRRDFLKHYHAQYQYIISSYSFSFQNLLAPIEIQCYFPSRNQHNDQACYCCNYNASNKNPHYSKRASFLTSWQDKKCNSLCGRKRVVNVTSMEGSFASNNGSEHVHINMAKASLKMVWIEVTILIDDSNDGIFFLGKIKERLWMLLIPDGFRIWNHLLEHREQQHHSQTEMEPQGKQKVNITETRPSHCLIFLECMIRFSEVSNVMIHLYTSTLPSAALVRNFIMVSGDSVK